MLAVHVTRPGIGWGMQAYARAHLASAFSYKHTPSPLEFASRCFPVYSMYQDPAFLSMIPFKPHDHHRRTTSVHRVPNQKLNYSPT
jgi:hypothetical protein